MPLWNSFSGTGLPQLLNWESAVLALPTIVGYVLPLSFSFLATVAVKLFIAGSGAYLCARLFRCRPLAAALGASTFMLVGQIVGWIAWAVSGPFVWLGWIAAATLLAYRSRSRVREVVLLALVVGLSLYGGSPESSLLMAIGLGVLFLGCTGVVSFRGGQSPRPRSAPSRQVSRCPTVPRPGQR